MAKYSKTNYKSKYGASGSSFPDNTTGIIQEVTVRTFGEDTSDSLISAVDDMQTLTSTSGTDAYSIPGGITAYQSGFNVQVKFSNASTTVSTLNVNTLGAKKIYKDPTTQAGSGDLVANQICNLVYDSTLDGGSGGFLIVGGGGSGGLTKDDLTGSRTLTTDGPLVQADNLNIVYADSATPFDITVDLLTVKTQVTIINKGSATVTLIEGAGVTLSGTTIPILPGGKAFIIYEPASVPYVYMSGEGGPAINEVYANITAMLADQSNQEENALYWVTTATTDTTVEYGWGLYRKLAASTASLSNYIKIQDEPNASDGATKDYVDERTANDNLFLYYNFY